MKRWAGIATWLFLGVACAKVPTHTGTSSWRDTESQAQVQLELADWHIENDKTQEAMSILKNLREQGLEGPHIDLLQARALSKEGLVGSAEPLLYRVIDELPRNPQPWATLGVIYADSGRIPEAIDALEKAKGLDESDPDILNNLGFIYLIEQRFDDARNVLKEAIGLDGTEPLYRNNLAFALVGLNEPQEALRLFRTTGPEPEARYNLGLAFARIGMNSSARVQLERAISLDPEHEKAKTTLDSLVSESGQEPTSQDESSEDASDESP